MTEKDWEKVKYFKKIEFVCPCCGRCEMDKELIWKLDLLRELVGEPLIIESGYRCERHNKAVGGAPNSAHLRGKAVDIRCTNSLLRYKILNYAFYIRFIRIGIAKNFVHIDIDRSLPHPRIWLYPAKKKKRSKK